MGCVSKGKVLANFYLKAMKLNSGSGDTFTVFNLNAQGIASGLKAVLIYCRITPRQPIPRKSSN